ncbi:MAG: rhomboid family intramembrane serine protease [Actinomycetota bacterium]
MAETQSTEQAEYCYRHPNEVTRIHCTRCGRPICPACMIPAPVGHHCPECVAEARREFRQGPRRRMGSIFGTSATQLLLLAIIAMFAIEVVVSKGRALANGVPNSTAFDLGALYPPAIAQGSQYWRLITVMFLHANLLHIALNGYALWLFGRFVEDTFGRIRFLLIYFVTGFLAAVTSYTFGPTNQLGVGASGAIVGLLGAFIVYNFRRRHMSLARGNLRWALMIIALNVVIGSAFNGIDNWAHGGGLVAGLLAGTFAEGIGPRGIRPAVRVLGFVALIVLGVVMTVLRTQALRS